MIKTTNLSEKIWLHEIKNTKFKINKISINFVSQFVPQTASQNTALALMLAKQCSKFPSTQLLGKKLKELYGADLNSSCSKLGDLQIVNFSISMINDTFALNNEPVLEQSFDLLCEMVFNPKTDNNLLVAKDIEIEKQNLIELISGHLSDKQKLAQLNAMKLLFKNENCAYPAFGSISQTQQINQTNLTNTYKNLLEVSQIHIVVSGTTNSAKLKTIFFKHAKNLNRSNSVNLKNRPFLVSNNFKPTTQQDFDDILQSKLILGFAAKEPVPKELVPALKTMVALLGATPTSKLFENVREKLSLCYYCATNLNLNKMVFWIYSGVNKKNIETATKAILEQLNEIKLGNFSERELQETKQFLISNLHLISDNINHLEGYHLRKILNNDDPSLEAEINAIHQVDSSQIIKITNIFVHALTYVLASS